MSVAALCLAACAAVYPELSTPLRSVPEGRALDSGPPKSLVYIAFERAEIPERTRDGRRWDRLGGSAPDPFAKLLAGGKELILTPVQSNTLTPTWPGQKRANYRVPPGTKLEVELWDANPINNRPICVKAIQNFEEQLTNDTLELECASGARVELTLAPARAKWGLGFYYELRTAGIAITRVIRESPAARAGVDPGDEIVQIQGRDVKALQEGEARSLVNTHAATGLSLTLRKKNGQLRSLMLKEGAIYPSIDEGVPLDS